MTAVPNPANEPSPPAAGRPGGERISLEASEERYRLLAGATSDILWDWDLTSGRVERNDALCTTFGYVAPAVEQTRDWWRARTHADDRAGIEAVVADALARQSAFSLEYRFLRADGTYATILDRAWIMRDAAGNAIRAVGSCVDISERKALESELRAKTERLAAMMDVQREIASASFDVVEALSRVAQRIARLGHGDGANIGRVDGTSIRFDGAFGVSFPADGKALALDATIVGHTVRTRESTVVWDIERDSRLDPALYRGAGIRAFVVLPLVAENRVVGAMAVYSAAPHVFGSEDVQALTLVGGMIAVAIANSERFGENQRLLTQRTSALAAARESEERYRMVADGTPVRISFIDREERYSFVNKAVAEFHGRSATEILGQRLADLAGPVNYDRIRPYVRAALSGREQQFDTEWDMPAADPRVLGVRLVPRRDEAGAVMGIFVIAVDETDRRSLEEQVQRTQRMEAVGQLAGGVAHDFNNLLTVIGGFAEMLQTDKRLASDQQKDIAEIGKATKRASELTRQLLAFGRKQTLQPALVDLNGVIAESERMLRRLVREDIALECKLATPLGTVFADPRQLEYVIVNLVVNARDATGEGGRITIETDDIEISAGPATPVAPGAWVRLRVSDTGVGMTPETLRHIFEPFFTTKRAGEGTGLGLAMAYGIIQQSGGAISAESEPGHGSTFSVLLPRADELPAHRKTPAHSPIVKAGGGERVLLVEDEEPVRALARRVLERAGYAVTLAKNGREALKIVDSNEKFALIVSDVVMPEMGGLELAERMIDHHPGLPILLMSGYAATEIERRGGVPEGAQFLQKPFGPDALLKAVRGALSSEAQS